MKVNEFIELLEQQNGKELLFEYANDKMVGANYHLTEVKNVQYDTTDCGGKRNFWEETHFQLWENPKEANKKRYMSTDKILAILHRVDSINPMKKSTSVRIEYGNDGFNTAVMPVQGIEILEKAVVVRLFEEKARCKANDACGIPKDAAVAQKEVTACCA